MHSGGVVGVVVAIGWLESVEVGIVNAVSGVVNLSWAYANGVTIVMSFVTVLQRHKTHKAGVAARLLGEVEGFSWFRRITSDVRQKILSDYQ